MIMNLIYFEALVRLLFFLSLFLLSDEVLLKNVQLWDVDLHE